jgi:glutaredoxin 3
MGQSLRVFQTFLVTETPNYPNPSLMAKIEIYTKTPCPFCVNAKQLLGSLGAEYQEINISESPERMQEMLDRTGGRTTVPEIFINEQLIGGFDSLLDLHRKGELTKLISE